MGKKLIAATKKPTDKYPGKVGQEKSITKKPKHPGKVGQEKPTHVEVFLAPRIVPIKPPPQTKAIEPAQKEVVLRALLEAWFRYPYLTLGQLLVRIGGEQITQLEDLPFAEQIRNYNPPHIIECGVLSPSRTFTCTLEKGHPNHHFSRDSGIVWQR